MPSNSGRTAFYSPAPVLRPAVGKSCLPFRVGGEINLPKPCVGPAVGWTRALCGMFTGMEGCMRGGSYGPNVCVCCRCALHADGVVQCATAGFKLRVCVPLLKSGWDPS